MEALRDGPMVVAVTGAAGQIGYALLPLICTGRMLGPNQHIELRLIEIEPALKALSGVEMELSDAAFPLLDKVVCTADPMVGFKDVDVCVLVGAFPRKAGMERKDLIGRNSEIFKVQGEAINKVGSPNVKILVVGNPCNTNAAILSHFAPKVPKKNITAMTRLDQNRLTGMVAKRLDKSVNQVHSVLIWGNHSSTQFPDVLNAKVDGVEGGIREALGGEEYIKTALIPAIQTRGAEIIKARGASSALSAASSACDHIRDWMLGSGDRVVSMGVFADGSYNVAEGIVYSFPVKTKRGGEFEIVRGMQIDAFSKHYLDITEAELRSEFADALSLLK
eukprot:CAMPEP_0184693776 /NCGR_PEP_ID=MMETSP0313-20130426/1934_1 /TAXON_ID=2792 /ORGANISM="Porphyridium aerugineum, Strain SAG 1380-2" /LENGTH=333 /DNA_ID=CAMNT_0027151941 /DNA_START=194 /DNA_END=1195 /DNA_ORIENTATION=+